MEFTIEPHKEKERFQDLAIRYLEAGKRSGNMKRIVDYLVADHAEITRGMYGSYKASFTIYLQVNFSRLEKYVDQLFEII